jgi:HAD superfamily hydrolase (TIGR01549 family)
MNAFARGVARPRALLFDLDGTLYRQDLLRGLMALELLPLLLRPGWADLRALRAFRRVRESLRASRPPGGAPLDELQFSETARVLGCAPARIQSVVEEWMYRRPLKYLAGCRRPGVIELLDRLASDGIQAGVLSDYPVTDKLRALGLLDRFSLRLATTDPEIDAFKPSARGFLRACELWGLQPSEVLYVGDRPEVDGAGAAAAGMSCWIVSGSRPQRLEALGERYFGA